MPRALLSVSDKNGIVELARALRELDWEILSTGGTARTLRAGGIDVTDVTAVTKHPEMMDGRVKTLHPAVHAGLLARRDNPADLNALAENGYLPIDLLAVNLYPFHEAVARRAEVVEAMEQVDIGGPAMLRAAAKNHAGVIVVVDPADYAGIAGALRRGAVTPAERRRLAQKVFAHTAAYDAAIAAYFSASSSSAVTFPDRISLSLAKVQDLRYGENPDQPAAFYSDASSAAGSLAGAAQLQGKELSFNNILDADAALAAIGAWSATGDTACAIIKHTTPCGVALGNSAEDAFRRALATDPVSAFGGIVAFNCAVTAAAATELANLFLEVVIAPEFHPEALALLAAKKNLRLLRLDAAPAGAGELDLKRVRGGFLAQTRMSVIFDEADWKVVTSRAPDADELRDLRFAWRVSASVKSNAIVLARDGRTLGIGAGQMSRVDSSRIAVLKARDQSHDLTGAALASDAFFPFRDGVDAAAAAGIRAVIQPGGSVRDDEVIAAANENGIAMVFTGRRVFRH